MHDANLMRQDGHADPRMNQRLEASPRSGKALGIGVAVVVVLAALALWMGGSGDSGQQTAPAAGDATMSQPAGTAPATNAPATSAPAANAPAANAPAAPQAGQSTTTGSGASGN
ncbi:hypothetical protein [Acidimangrovimonas sediminis]|uniref:hypothetical protein n=1 Tax=Acidimangrovimonas sediminis TaxID=2056283 RepID=UPI000C80A7AE|nr:hypothetical protein [Acidimangrovimonas sediminis]